MFKFLFTPQTSFVLLEELKQCYCGTCRSIVNPYLSVIINKINLIERLHLLEMSPTLSDIS